MHKRELVELYNIIFDENKNIKPNVKESLIEFCSLLSLNTGIQCYSNGGLTENWYYVYLSAIDET